MSLIRNKVRQLPVSKDDFLVVLNREWQAVLSAAERIINARMGTVITVEDASYSVAAGVQVVLANSASGNITVTLPAASSSEMRVVVKKISASNAVTVQAGAGDSVHDGLSVLLADGEASEYVSDGGTTWHMIGEVT